MSLPIAGQQNARLGFESEHPRADLRPLESHSSRRARTAASASIQDSCLALKGVWSFDPGSE